MAVDGKVALNKSGATTRGKTRRGRGHPETLGPRWQPGQSGNPKGRPKGSRNKLGEEFLDALQADFSKHGSVAIETVRTERPHEYLKVIASILPKELNVNTRAVEELSDDDIVAAIARLRSFRSPEDVGEGSEAPSRH